MHDKTSRVSKFFVALIWPKFFSPSFFYLTIFFPPDFRMLSVSQKYSIEQKMTTLETAKSAKKTLFLFCGSLKNDNECFKLFNL